MKLSEYILKQKSEGKTREEALKNSKAAIKAIGKRWSAVRDQVFVKYWAKHVDAPATPVVHKPIVAPIHTPVKPIARPATQHEDHTLGALHQSFDNLHMKVSLNSAKVFFKNMHKYYNHLHFSNRLPDATFRFLKNAGKFFRQRAQYNPGLNEFAYSRRMFNIDFDKFCETFVHEMCHQAVHKIDNRVGYYTSTGRRDIHGEPWKKWMRHCGLDPARCDKTDNMDYMLEHEKNEVLKKKNEVETQQADKTPVLSFTKGKIAQYYSTDTKEWVKGVIICPENASKKRYIFATSINRDRLRYLLVPRQLLFNMTPYSAQQFDTPDWVLYVEFLFEKYQQHLQQKKEHRIYKKMIKNGW